MSSPERKRKKRSLEPSPESTPNPSLPDDLIVSILARVSRLYYPILSLVSKSSRTLVTSPELYKTRSFFNRTESCLYVCLDFPPDPNPRWFTLYRKPNQNITEKTKNSSGSHTWHEAPSMRMKRNYPAANVVDGKIYVAGGLEEFDSSKWMEVFDIKTQTWEFVLSPLAERFIYRSLVIEGEIYIFGDKVVTYKPKEDRWGGVGEHQSMDLGLFFHSYCVIDNVLYCYRPGGIKWYESEKRSWRKLRGLKGLSKLASSCVKLADYGGKMALLWDKYIPCSGNKSHSISCAVVSLERCKNQGIRGKVEWFDDMLTVPSSYNFVGALAATL
ncbi:Galactose oxidase/kelch repeat superfamily protein [Arabidopsis thaliana]|uniref:Isoform 2 of F-box/kelch-repeat protein At5g49000 n=1 Tax=Arabidopsis thaliana TaxID=3702 RepID=Q9FI70-2|nr:Galactose oxidase/kelch repeat superfamily protein [Arabidopsis thaliana]AED95754.1 Galactose oxidase/kelch repeat superfamily protein [Arabidopsis thaliana]|eukprot:NP_199711.2 Galactose oxidase/kelch repeat superfamily protein [Arabidopsis thaliana]